MGNSLSHISGQKCAMQSLDSMPATTSLVNARPSTDIKTLAVIQRDGVAQESRVLSLKRKIESDDSVSPRKQRILESYSTGDICRIVTTPIKINRQNTDFTSPTARRLYKEASDIFLKRKADTPLAPFSIKRVKLYEPCNTTAFIWSLPAEILIAIIALLGSHDLRSLTCVCSLLREIAGPIFFVNRNFPTSPQDMFHIRVDSSNFDVLATWRRMDTFCPPRMMLCWLDPDLRSKQLSAFSHFLQSIPHKSTRHITLFWNFDILSSPVLPEIITFLESIRSSGCEDLTCMGFYDHVGSSSVTGLAHIQRSVDVNQLKAFEASSRVLFSPQLLPFTIQTIRFSSLEKLRLSSIKLSSAHWAKLLRHLAIPTLVELRVDADCAPSTLICFLARHPAIDHLTINPRPGVRWRTNRVTTPLTLSMTVLNGPLSHVLPVLRCHRIPPTLICLDISLQDDDASPDYITTILRCVDYCDSVGYLLLSIPPQSHSHLAMSCIPGIHSVVPVKHLAIDYSDAPVLRPASAGDALALSAAWIEAFPKVEHVSMRGYSTVTTGDLVRIMRRYAVDDVVLSVELQSHTGM